MSNNLPDDVNFTSLVELFSTFFEKVTNSHPQKDNLGKQLSNFKQMLYNNKTELNIVDHYLDDLRKKTQASVHINIRPLPSEKSPHLQPNNVSPKDQPTAATKYFKTFDPDIVKLGLKPQKFDLHTVADFFKSHTLEQATQKQTLLNRYSYVREFDLDSSNFYRLIAIGTITHLIHDQNSHPKFVEIIEDVTSRKIVLKNYYYSYSHDEYMNVFCGYLEQLVQAKTAGQTVEKVLELFHEMIKYDHLFNIALLCYLKGKLVSVVTEKIPKMTSGETSAVWEQLQSPDIGEKILNNNPMVIEPLLGVLPYLLNLKIVTQVLENGALYERIYSKSLLSSGQSVMRSSENSGPAIHLLIEKIFTTSNYYLLQPSEAKSMNNSSELGQKSNSTVASGTQNASTGLRNQIIVPSPKYTEADVKELAIELSDSPARKVTHNSKTSSFYRPKVGHDLSRNISDSPSEFDPFKKRDLSAPRPRSNNNFTKSPRYFLTPSRLRPLNLSLERSKEGTRSENKRPATESAEIVNTSLIPGRLHLSNENENNGLRGSSLLRSPQTGNNDLKDRSQSVNTPSGRPSVPKNPVSLLVGRENTPSSNKKPPESKAIGEFTRQIDMFNAAITSDKLVPEAESPYDAYIKTRAQTSVLDQPAFIPTQSSATSYSTSTQPPSTILTQPSASLTQPSSSLTQTSGNLTQPPNPSQSTPKDRGNSKIGSVSYTGITVTTTPYDNYVSVYGNRAYLAKGADQSGSTASYNHPTTTNTEGYKGLISSASTNSIQIGATATAAPANKYGTTGYFTSNSPSKNTFKGTSNPQAAQAGYSNLGAFTSNNGASPNPVTDIDQMLKDRFKNMFTLAPRTNDTLPLNPFSQAGKYTGTVPSTDTKDTQETAHSNPYSYSSKYNSESFRIPKYGTSYTQSDKTPVSTTLQEIQNAKSLQAMISTQKIGTNVNQNSVPVRADLS